MVSTGTYQQQHRRVEESTVSQVATTSQAPIDRAAQLRLMGLVEVTPGVFHEIAAVAEHQPAAAQQVPPVQPQAAVQNPFYIPPPLPTYAPPFMPSPIRPGFEGMPQIPQFGGKFVYHLPS